MKARSTYTKSFVHPDIHFYDSELYGAGCDGVVIRLVSIKTVVDRIQKLSQKKRKFMVTKDYAGSEREDIVSIAQETVRCVIAPNCLNEKIYAMEAG